MLPHTSCPAWPSTLETGKPGSSLYGMTACTVTAVGAWGEGREERW